MRMLRLLAAVALALPILLLAGPAGAHVLLDAVQPRGDGTVDLVFTFEHGCLGQAATDGLEMTVPDHTVVVDTAEPDGWTRRIDDRTITWSGPAITDGTPAEFVVTARVGAIPGETVLFPATQICAGAPPYHWDDPADGDPEPAPRFVATSASVDPALRAAEESGDSGAGVVALVVALGGSVSLAAGAATMLRRGRARATRTAA